MKVLCSLSLFGLSKGALGALAFLVLVLFLLIYSIVYNRKRLEHMDRRLAVLGFRKILEPVAAELVPDLLFHPNGFESSPFPRRGWSGLPARVPAAWQGHLGPDEVDLFEVTIDYLGGAQKSDRQLNRTVLRFDPPQGSACPDFLLKEWVILKGQIRGARAVNGPPEIGRHYYLFSDAPDDALKPWITTALRDQLAQHRLWTLAAHDGTIYLTRNSSPQRAADLPSFLAEGEALVSGLKG